jgi:AsmA protein
VASALSAWTGGEVKITGPLSVRYFPRMSLRGGFTVRDPSRLPMVRSIAAKDAKVTLDLFDLLLGRVSIDALRLGAPEIVLRDKPAPIQSPQMVASYLLSGTPFGSLRFRRGTVSFPTESGRDSLRDFEAQFDTGINGTLSGSGSFNFRNESVRFTLDGGRPSATENGTSVPVTFKMSSLLVAATLAGTANFNSETRFEGNMQTEIPNVRQFLRWLGVALPAGQSLQALTASGNVHWSGSTLNFDNGTFALDGNSADGVLAIRVGARPRLDGTLAFERLHLDPYIKTDETAPETQAGPLFDWALLKYLDADLRISAAEIETSALKLGRGGLTINAKHGVLAGELGELEICGGSAAGRISLDLSEAKTKANFVANLSDISIEECVKPLALGVALAGVGRLKVEAVTEGGSWDELVRGLSGALKLNARDGTVPVDFSRIATAAAPLEGWSTDGFTPFDTLKGDCRLAAGHIWCQMFSMRTRGELISGSGDVDLGRQTLDVSLLIANAVNSVRAAARDTSRRVSISGALSQPMMRRADRPTLGEGRAGTSPDVVPVSPR